MNEHGKAASIRVGCGTLSRGQSRFFSQVKIRLYVIFRRSSSEGRGGGFLKTLSSVLCGREEFFGVLADIHQTYIRAGTGFSAERCQECSQDFFAQPGRKRRYSIMLYPPGSTSSSSSAARAASKPSRSAAVLAAADTAAWLSAGCVAAWICCKARMATWV